MKIEDIDREFKELARSLKEAQQAFSQGNFAQAEPLYKRALELVERSYGEDHADTMLCVQNLADTYYSLRKYKEAVPLFRRLLVIKEKTVGVAHPDVAVCLFKLAKTYEKLGMPREAESIYRRAVRVAEQAYGQDHSFVATILESFAGMLRRAQIRLKEASEMEERVRDIRERLGNPNKLSQNLLGNLQMSIPPGSAEAVELAMNAKTLDKGSDTTRLRSLRSTQGRATQEQMLPSVPAVGNPKMLLLIAGVLVLLGAGGAVAFTMLAPKKPDVQDSTTTAWSKLSEMMGSVGGNKDQSSSWAGRTINFVAPDGQKSVSLVDAKNAVFTRKGIDMKGTYDNEASMIVITPESQSINYNYRKIKCGLIDDDETVLYASDAPETIVLYQMKFLANTVNKYYRQLGQYPMRIEDVLAGEKRVSYQNPSTGQTTIPVRRSLLGRDQDASDFDLNEYADLENATRQLFIWTPVKQAPFMIEFYRNAAGPDGDSIYIRGTDRLGALLRGSKPGAAFVLVCTQGRTRISQ